MNENLKVLNLMENTDNKKISNFNDNVRSNFEIDANYEKVTVNFEWLDLMEDTMRYLDNILRNPNRFIVNEEEVVKVEQARRITVESIKHLARHTNYIQEIEKNGDVKPSKILNINKDESYNTYENRLIYTLIQNINDFVEIKKKSLLIGSSLKDIKKCEYHGASKVGKENVNINISLDSRVVARSSDGSNENGTLAERIEKLEWQIKDLMNSDVYKSLARAHVARTIPPIKKTNLILKNTNFQYAMKLWDYLQNHVANDDKKVKSNKKYDDDPTLKAMFDDTFLLNYLIVNSVTPEENNNLKDSEKTKAIEEITDNLINKIVEINSDLPIEKLQEQIGQRLAIVHYQKEASLSEITKVFKKNIEKFNNRIEEFKF
jgi:predicted component of viral defense system (DUF524 family)